MSTFDQTRSELLKLRRYWLNHDYQIYARKQTIDNYLIRMRDRISKNKIISPIEEEPEWKTVEILRDNITFYEKNQKNINTAIKTVEAKLDELGDTPKIISQHWDAQIPTLLMPLRVHTRFVKVKHITKLKKEDVFDISDSNTVTSSSDIPTSANQGAWAKQGANQVFAYNNFLGNMNLEWQLKESEDREWLQNVEDTYELWVRIYPDEIFIHAHEEFLTFEEIESGKSFWQKFWSIEKQSAQLSDSEKRNQLIEAWKQLQDAHLSARAAWIYKMTMPQNFPSKNGYADRPHFFKHQIAIRTSDWTRPLRTFILPDKFTVNLYASEETRTPEKTVSGNRVVYPLALSNDPLQENLNGIPEEINWITDFQEAEKIGLGIRIPISALEYNSGFERLVVLGLNTTIDKNEGKEALENLLINHHYKDGGLNLIPQGTPTNNFEEKRSGYSFKGPPAEETFTAIHEGVSEAIGFDWTEKTDAHFLAELLGIDLRAIKNISYGNNRGLFGAKGMNHLLWSATWGYYLEQFFEPILSKNDVEKIRSFFVNNVSARGWLPPIQVGNQPYGILATTAYSKLLSQSSFLNNKPFEKRLFEQALMPLNDYWGRLAKQVPHIGDGSILNKYSEEFKELVNLNASTVELYYRPIIGYFLLHNLYRYQIIETPEEARKASNLHKTLFDEEARAGYFPDWLPEGLNQLLKNGLANKAGKDYDKARIFHRHQYQFYGKTSLGMGFSPGVLNTLYNTPIKDLKNAFTKGGVVNNNQNFFAALAWQSLSWEAINAGISLKKNDPICRLDFENHLADDNQLKLEQLRYLEEVLKRDPRNSQNQHIFYRTNKWNYLEQDYGGSRLEDWMDKQLNEILETGSSMDLGKKFEAIKDAEILDLAKSKLALKVLSKHNPADLQRLFTEHIDLCANRLDAWLQGVVNQRLFELRSKDAYAKGIYLGAYGYLENVSRGDEEAIWLKEEKNPVRKPFSKAILKSSNPVVPILDFDSFEQGEIDLDQLLSNAWVYLGSDYNDKFEQDPDQPDRLVAAPLNPSTENQGFMQTPSELHAITAAILRSGFKANQTDNFVEAFAIDLSSARIRKALYLINGVKNGQSLSALLGYQFERFLHDNASGPLDKYILNFRKKFPLQIDPAYGNNGENEYLASYRTLDGFKLTEYYRALADHQLTSTEKEKIKNDFSIAQSDLDEVITAIEQLLRNMDAVSDLILAESVYQVTKGDLEASANALKMLNNETSLTTPEIVKTESKKNLLRNVVGICFDDQTQNSLWSSVPSPKSIVNPRLNNWLSQQLPSPNQISVNVRIENQEILKINLEELNIQPIDFIDLFKGKNALSQVSELSKLIRDYIKNGLQRPEIASINLAYQDKTSFSNGEWTVYEIKPLIEVLNQLLGQSRALLPIDLQLETQIDSIDDNPMPTIDNSRMIKAFRELKKFGEDYDFNQPLTEIEAETDKYQQWLALKKLSSAVFGEHFLIFPEFELANKVEFDLAYQSKILQQYETDFITEEWHQGVAQIRKKMKTLQSLKQMRTLLNLPSDSNTFEVIQLPFRKEDYYWLGTEFPSGADLKRDNLSILLELPDTFHSANKCSGIVIDTWKEELPERHKTGAIAMNYNQPNVEPPQTALLCVSPMQDGNWEWGDLIDTVLETMELAKKRAVDFDLIAKGLDNQVEDGIQKNPLKYLLPAIVAPVCINGDTPWVDFSGNIHN